MQTPENLAGALTEKIMAEIKPFVNDYNKTYSRVYQMVKPHAEANEKALQEFENYQADGAFYGHGLYNAMKMLKECVG